MNLYEKCELCPRKCGINRSIKTGYCYANDQLLIARAALHMWEEPCISGVAGSGAIFFGGCNMGCIFCQNSEISRLNTQSCEKEEKHCFPVSVEQLADIMLRLQEQKANNINLVTPTHFIPSITEGIRIAKRQGLTIPIVYNTSGYENVTSLKLLEGLIDVYLPDFKYMDDQLAVSYSNAPGYAEVAKAAIDEMVRQTQATVFDERGVLKKGVIVRHLMLPGHFMDSLSIIQYLYTTYHNLIYISIMNQYTPIKTFEKFPELNRKISIRSYNHLIDIAIEMGVTNAFIQEGSTSTSSFIPSFHGEGVIKNY